MFDNCSSCPCPGGLPDPQGKTLHQLCSHCDTLRDQVGADCFGSVTSFRLDPGCASLHPHSAPLLNHPGAHTAGGCMSQKVRGRTFFKKVDDLSSESLDFFYAGLSPEEDHIQD